MDNDERGGGGGGRSGGGGSFDDFLSYLSGEPPPATTSGGSSSAPPVFLPPDVARAGNDDATAPPPSGFEPPIEPSAPPLSELEAEESEKTRRPAAPPSVVYATAVPHPFAPNYQATAPDDVYVIPTPSASSATTRRAAFPERPLPPPEMPAASPSRPSDPPSTNQPLSTGAGAGDATTTPSAPSNQGGDEQRILKYKVGLLSSGLLTAAVIIAAVAALGVDRPDPPSAAPTIAPTTSPTTASSLASLTASPTSTPTASPTSTPTASPVEYPTTASPTIEPTTSPITASPSEYPTIAPTTSPITASPSEYPTIAPTTSPITASPSESPLTASPTIAQTSAPVAYPPAPWIWVQQGQVIVGDAEGDYFGVSVAMSADAKTLVVGATGWNDLTGYVQVYRTNDDGWNSMQLIGQSIFGEAVGDYFGNSVDISPDGKTVAIGAAGHFEVNDRPGYVQVFYLESDDFGSSWMQLGQDITGDANGDQFGIHVSLSNDGKTLAVGANGIDGNGEDSGCVRIYHLEDDGTSSWEQIGQDIYGEAVSDDLGLGWTVSLSADGTTVAMGGPWNDDNGDDSGQVRVYQIDSAGSTWEQLGQDINGEAAYDYFGYSVDISSDGKTLAIGAPGYSEKNDRPGYVRVYYLESNGLTSSWMQIGQDIIGQAIGDEFGWSVSLSDDGKTLAIGARTNDGNGAYSGHVQVYRMDDSSTSWTQVGEDIEGQAEYDYSGVSVSLSADGTTVAIGAYGNDDNGVDSGHVRIVSIK